VRRLYEPGEIRLETVGFIGVMQTAGGIAVEEDGDLLQKFGGVLSGRVLADLPDEGADPGALDPVLLAGLLALAEPLLG
jgi:hypothetical protein